MPAGTVVPSSSLVAPGGAQGVPGPNAVSADSGNQATFGSDSKIYVPDPTPVITSVRLRSYSSIGNGNFETDQRQVGAALTNPATGTFVCDRWSFSKGGSPTFAVNTQRITPASPITLPGTNYPITNGYARLTLTTQQASLGVSDSMTLRQAVEGPAFRELSTDVHSISLLVRSSVTPLNFGVTLRDVGLSRSLTSLCNYSAASNVWQLITIPNLAVWPAVTWSVSPGVQAYWLDICLAAGSSVTASSNGTWLSSNVVGALGQDSWASKATSSTFDVAVVQHEPGPNCTTLIDLPFQSNLDACQRYFYKSQSYTAAIGSAGGGGVCFGSVGANQHPYGAIAFKKTMAKSPTVTIYSNSTGAINNVRDVGGAVDRAGAAAQGVGDSGFGGCTITTPNSAAWTFSYSCTADTGW